MPGALLYPLLYAGVLQAAFLAWPDLPAIWSGNHFWERPLLLGMPLGELNWALAAGAFWLPIVAFTLDIRLTAPSR